MVVCRSFPIPFRLRDSDAPGANCDYDDNSTRLLVTGTVTRVLITRLTANFVGMSTGSGGVVVSYSDKHINNNISVNGAPTVVQTPQ